MVSYGIAALLSELVVEVQIAGGDIRPIRITPTSLIVQSK